MTSRRGRGKHKLASGDGSGFEAWGGYMAAKVTKLQQQYRDAAPAEGAKKGDTTNIFKGISIFVNGYTQPSSAELKILMMQHGGTYHHYYNRQLVTHIIANNLPDSKIMNLTNKKVVSPNWISDSIKAEKLLAYEDYLLYTNRSRLQPGMQKFAMKIPKTDSTTSNVSSTCTSNVDSGDTIPTNLSAKESSLESFPEHPDKTESSPSKAIHGDSEKNGSTMNKPSSSVCDKSLNKTASESGPARTQVLHEGSRSIGDARDPNFLSEFYSNSRLHHISTWGAEYKAYVSRLHTSGDTSFPGRENLRDLAASSVDGEGNTAGKRHKKTIMHIDMDCFFVSVGLRKRPDLKGKPVAVTHSKGKGRVKEREGTDVSYEESHYAKKGLRLKKGPGKGKLDPNKVDLDRNPDYLAMMDQDDFEEFDEERFPANTNTTANSSRRRQSTSADKFNSMSEIASCNYEARKAGVKNGMFMGAARALCPDLETIPYDFDGYQEVSRLLYDTVASFTHDIEAVSCDEMLVDCTDLLADTGASTSQFAHHLRQLIKEKTGCDASAGFGPNILLARMATRVAKPNGQFQLQQEEARAFLKDKSVRDLPGVGRAMTNKFASLNVTTCGDLQAIPLHVLQKEFGPKTGQSLHKYSLGEDDRVVKYEHDRKSVSAEVNYGIRFKSESDVERFINELAGEVCSRLQKLSMRGKTISLKLKVRAEGAPKETAKFLGHGICDNITKSTTIPAPTDNALIIAKEVMGILRALRIPPTEHRGVGIQVSRLEAPVEKRSGLTRGNQSILNFATKRNQVVDTTSATTPPEKSLAVSNGGEETLHELDRDQEATHSRITEEYRVEGNVEGQSGLPSRDTETEENTDVRVEAIGCNDEPSNRSKNPVVLPRLPKLPSFLSPTPGRSSDPAVTATPPAPTVTGDILLPSPSQVDPEVLRELPEDIRLQIESALAATKSDRRTRSSTKSLSSQEKGEPTASSSTIDLTTNEPTTSGRITRKSKQNDAIVALPSLSQLDPSCLDALPPEMKEELLSAYRKETGGAAVTAPPVHPLMLPKNRNSSPNKPGPGKQSPGKRSPGKLTSPSRKKTSPLFKKPRGKGPGRPRKQLNFGKSSGKTADTISPLVPAGGKAVQVTPSTSTSDAAAAAASSSHQADQPLTGEGMSSTDQPTGVHLCGAVTLPDVKNLIREWTLSSDAPEDEDVNHLTRYLRDLVADLNLERLHQVILYLRRCLRKRPLSVGWESTYQAVINTAQAEVRSVYGSRLNL